MKKHLSSIAALLIAALTFTSCGSDDPAPYIPTPVEVSNGAFFIGSGNKSASIMGNLAYYDYAKGTAMLTPFETANGIELGLTANDGIVYGSKLYIVVDNENTIFVCNKNTMKIITRISTTDMLGAEAGISPRHIIADGGSLYFTTYGNVVAKIDTTAFTLQKTYNVGSYPEGLAITDDGNLYVCNSDYGYGNASISKINIATSESETLTNENIRNPQTIAIYGTGFYFLDYGVYGPAPDYAQEHAGVYRYSYGTVTQVVPNATGMAAYGQTILTYNTPYGGDGVSYSMYDVSSGTLSSYQPKDIEYPAAIEIDPVTGYVIIASYKMVTSEWGTYPDYTSNGYVNIYADDFNTVSATFECGVSPTRIVLNPSIVTVNY
jgi:hypothetical protein